MGKVPLTPFYNSRDSETPPKKQSPMNMESTLRVPMKFRFTSPRWEQDHITAILGRLMVHPRVCGEQPRIVLILTSYAGSSPRVRGTGDSEGFQSRYRRFIPACAGNSPSGVRMPNGIAVHPRVCGEQYSDNRVKRRAVGSSPRVRGTALPGVPCRSSLRFIPACAGNRSPRLLTSEYPTVHPRVCGEQVQKIGFTGNQTGSSPRVRGTD